MGQHAHSSPEVALLLACGRAAAHGEMTLPESLLVDPGVVWPRFLALARRHRMLPMVARVLTAHAARLPSEVVVALARAGAANALRVGRLAKALEQLLTAFADAGIAVICMRGPVLSHQSYGDSEWRQFDDLDLLVHAADMAGAIEVVLSLGGYQPYGPSAEEPCWRERAATCGMTFVDEAYGLWVDLASRPYSASFPVTLAEAWLWEQVVAVPWRGREVWSLTPGALVLVLAVHGAKHAWRHLAWVVDFAAVSRLVASDRWPPVWDDARRAGVMRPVALARQLAAEGFGAPADALAGVPPGVISRCARSVWRVAWQEPARPQRQRERIGMHAAMRDSMGSRVRYLLRLIVLPTRRDRLSAPACANHPVLLFLLRPWLLLGRRLGWLAVRTVSDAAGRTKPRRVAEPSDVGSHELQEQDVMIQLLAEGHACRFLARGQSMAPLLPDRSPVVVAPPGAGAPLLVGDVVVAVPLEPTASVLLHRVVRTDAERVLLQGDNRADPDGWFGRDQVLGRLVALHPCSAVQRWGVLGRGRALLGWLARYRPVVFWLRPLRWLRLGRGA